MKIQRHESSTPILTHSMEALLLHKSKQLTITKADFIVTPTIQDLVTLYPFNYTQDEALDLFKDIRMKRNKLKVMKFTGFHIRNVIKTVIESKPILINGKETYTELKDLKKDYDIGTISTNIETFKNMSYMYNINYLLDQIKTKTFGKDNKMSEKRRTAVLNAIKSEITTTSTSDRTKILYFKGPFLSNTGISLTLTDASLLKTWSPLLLLLEWFMKDEDGFKKYLLDNKIALVLDNTDNSYLVVPPSKEFMDMPTFNFKNLLKFIHRLDGNMIEDEVDDGDTGLDELTSDLVEDDIDDTSITDVLNSDTNIELEDDIFEESNEITEVLTDNDGISNKPKFTKEDIERIFSEATDEDKSFELQELHNYTKLKADMETPFVKNLRKKMNRAYGLTPLTKAELIKKHALETTTFNNRLDNDYNKNFFMQMDKTYSKKLGEEDMIRALTAPSELSIPLFLKDYKKIPINDREFRGYELKVTYQTFQGEDITFELEVPTIENNSMFIGGSNKYITNQDLAKPIIKVDEDVIITMSYNKSILNIKGKYSDPSQKPFIKTLNNYSKESTCLKIKTTDTLSEFIYQNRVSYEMLSINRHFGGIRYLDDERAIDIDIDFRGISKEGNESIMGTLNNQRVKHIPEGDIWFIEFTNERYKSQEFIEMILKLINEDLFTKSKVTKLDNLNFVNSIYATIMAREIPIIYLMLIETPLKDLLERLKVENDLEYKIVSNSKLDVSKLKNTSEYGYLILEDATIRIKYNNPVNSLILVPLVQTDLTGYKAFDITEVMSTFTGNDNTSMYLENFVTSFIANDIRVLQMYNMPTDFTGVFIYAASLFYDYKTTYSSDASNYRLITPSEVINRIMYETIAKEFSNNAARTKRGSRQNVRIPKDQIIRTLQTTMTNVSEDSNISPFRTISLRTSKSVAPLHSNMWLKSS